MECMTNYWNKSNASVGSSMKINYYKIRTTIQKKKLSDKPISTEETCSNKFTLDWVKLVGPRTYNCDYSTDRIQFENGR